MIGKQMTVREWFEDAAMLEKFAKPYDGPPIDMCWSRSERAFRYRLKRAIRIVEETYGVTVGDYPIHISNGLGVPLNLDATLSMTFHAIEGKN